MDPAERVRVNVPTVPQQFKPSIIRAPVHWRNNCLMSKQFCRHNLFITNPIILRIRLTWVKRYTCLRFVQTDKLRSKSDNPLSPQEMQSKVLDQCEAAKGVLLNVSNSNTRATRTTSCKLLKKCFRDGYQNCLCCL
jgi:hypothetical protein